MWRDNQVLRSGFRLGAAVVEWASCSVRLRLHLTGNAHFIPGPSSYLQPDEAFSKSRGTADLLAWYQCAMNIWDVRHQPASNGAWGWRKERGYRKMRQKHRTVRLEAISTGIRTIGGWLWYTPVTGFCSGLQRYARFIFTNMPFILSPYATERAEEIHRKRYPG